MQEWRTRATVEFITWCVLELWSLFTGPEKLTHMCERTVEFISGASDGHVIDGGRRGEVRGSDRDTERQCINMCYLFSGCVCVCVLWWDDCSPVCTHTVWVCTPGTMPLFSLCVSLCVSVCLHLCILLCVFMYCRVQPSVNIRLTGEQSPGALEPKLPQLHFVREVPRSWTHLRRALVCLVQDYVMCLQLSSKAKEVTLSLSISVTGHAIHTTFRKPNAEGRVLAYQLVFSQQRGAIRGKKVNKETERVRAPTFLQRTSWWSKRKKTRCWLRPYGW